MNEIKYQIEISTFEDPVEQLIPYINASIAHIKMIKDNTHTSPGIIQITFNHRISNPINTGDFKNGKIFYAILTTSKNDSYKIKNKITESYIEAEGQFLVKTSFSIDE